MYSVELSKCFGKMKAPKFKKIKKESFNLTSVLVGLTVVVIAVSLSICKSEKPIEVDEPKVCEVELRNDTLKSWVLVNNMNNGWNKNDNSRSMKRVFKRLGYEQVNGLKDDWDVLWTVGNPFEGTNLSNTVLKPHQRINHFIGMPLLTTKRNLVTQTKSKYIPQAFQFPSQIDDFKEFIKNNPNKKFVVKNYDNRGVKIVKEEEIDYNSTKKFVQEFIEDPLLIDDRAFDFGVYVLITSISPLRIYRFKSEVLVRFCPEPYHPFDPNNVEKYVVQDSHRTVWEMPSLKKYSEEFGFSYKTSVESHLASRGINVNKLWEQIDDAIVTLIQEKELQFTRLVNTYSIYIYKSNLK